jgi:hypothetical protein
MSELGSESDDEGPVMGRVEGRLVRRAPWRYSYGGKLEEILSALRRVVSLRHMGRQALDDHECLPLLQYLLETGAHDRWPLLSG